jgi:hypothetical protein
MVRVLFEISQAEGMETFSKAKERAYPEIHDVYAWRGKERLLYKVKVVKSYQKFLWKFNEE